MHSPSTEGSCSTDLRPTPLNSSSASSASIYQPPARDPAPRFSWASMEEAQSKESWSALSSCPPLCHLHMAAKGWGAQGCRAQVTPSEGSPLCPGTRTPEHIKLPRTQQSTGHTFPARALAHRHLPGPPAKAPVATLIVLMLRVHKALRLEGCWGGGQGDHKKKGRGLLRS